MQAAAELSCVTSYVPVFSIPQDHTRNAVVEYISNTIISIFSTVFFAEVNALCGAIVNENEMTALSIALEYSGDADRIVGCYVRSEKIKESLFVEDPLSLRTQFWALDRLRANFFSTVLASIAHKIFTMRDNRVFLKEFCKTEPGIDDDEISLRKSNILQSRVFASIPKNDNNPMLSLFL